MKKLIRIAFADASASTAFTCALGLGLSQGIVPFKATSFRLIGVQATILNSDAWGNQFRLRMGDELMTGQIRCGGPSIPTASTVAVQWLVNAPVTSPSGGQDATGFLPEIEFDRDVSLKIDTTASAYQISSIGIMVEFYE